MNTFQIKQLFNDAWQDYKNYWPVIFLILATYLLLNIIDILSGSTVVLLLTSLASAWLGIGSINFFLNIVDGKKAEYRDIFYGVKTVEQFVLYILVSIAFAIGTMLGFILLIVPGVIFSVASVFVTYYIAENRLGFSNAFKSSWEITKGNRWKIFLFGIVTILFNLLGLIALVAGLLITIPMTQLMLARMFRQLEGIPLPEAGSEPVDMSGDSQAEGNVIIEA